MEFIGADEEAFAETAIHHDSDDIQRSAAVAVAAAAGVALSAVHVGFNAAAVAGFEVVDLWSDFEDFDTELMAGDAWVAEERELSKVTAQIGPADAHAMGAYEDFTGAWWGRVGDVDELEVAGFFESNGFHGVCYQTFCRRVMRPVATHSAT
ncbi:MAG: hypothetical protein RL215_3053 [Planctomycetota bacterium]